MWNERRAREVLLDTVADVRMDGTMASISGTDAPNILITKTLQQYIEQTQDISVLMEERAYFDDANHRQMQYVRTNRESAKSLDTRVNKVYKGTILEHLLVLHLIAFYEKQPSQEKAMELADCLMSVAGWIERLLEKQGVRHLEIAAELDVLLSHREDLLEEKEYGSQVLEQYIKSVQAERSGGKTHLPARLIIDSLISKAKWLQGKEDKDE